MPSSILSKDGSMVLGVPLYYPSLSVTSYRRNPSCCCYANLQQLNTLEVTEVKKNDYDLVLDIWNDRFALLR